MAALLGCLFFKSIRMKKTMKLILISMMSMLFICGTNSIAFNANKKVFGVFPETIEITNEDPHCDCLLSDNFNILDNDSGELVYFLDNKGYLKKYYYLESERSGDENNGDYGGSTYKLKVQYLDRTFTIVYKTELCPGYKKCNEGKIYKNIIVSIK
jgi:hypothetical protein